MSVTEITPHVARIFFIGFALKLLINERAGVKGLISGSISTESNHILQFQECIEGRIILQEYTKDSPS